MAKDVSKFIDNDFEREVNSYSHTLGSMIHLTADTAIMDQIKHGYEHDPQLNGAFVPAGITYDHTSGLYYMADKVVVPNDMGIRE